MKPVEFAGQTQLLGPPRNSQRGDCGALPVRIVSDETWGRLFFSYWRPSPEELAVLNAGGHVRLQVCNLHPPLWVDAEKVEELP